MPNSFSANFRQISRMLTTEWMAAEMLRRGKAVEEAAKADAPVDETGPHPGRYRDGIHTRTYTWRGTTMGGSSIGSRVVARVEVTEAGDGEGLEALFVEYGTKHQEAHHTLRRALDAAKG